MPARIVYVGAALLLVAALFGVRAGPRGVDERDVWIAEHLPARVYESRVAGAAGTPVLALSHGAVGDRSLMGSLARRLASQGLAVIAFDTRGHGRNRLPAGDGTGDGEGALDDFDAVVVWARGQPGYDGQRVAIGGHGTGAAAAFAYAERRDPGVAAVVGISGASRLRGPYRPPNALLVWGERDSSRLRASLRARGAELIAANRVVIERTYGSFERGSAVRLSEIEGAGHLSILYDAGAVREISSWLKEAVAPQGGAGAPTDARLYWAVLGLAASLVLLWGLPSALAGQVPPTPLPEPARPVPALVAVALSLAGAGLLLPGGDGGRGPLAAWPVAGGRDILALFALAGVALATWAALGGRLQARGLGSASTWAGAGLVFASGYLAFGTFAAPFWDPLLTSRAVVPWLAASLLLLPWFGACEWLLRGPSRQRVWLPAAARLLMLVALAAGAWTGRLPAVVLPTLPPIALGLAVFEVLAHRTSRASPSPWLAAVPPSMWTAWLLTAFFPYSGSA